MKYDTLLSYICGFHNLKHAYPIVLIMTCHDFPDFGKL